MVDKLDITPIIARTYVIMAGQSVGPLLDVKPTILGSIPGKVQHPFAFPEQVLEEAHQILDDMPNPITHLAGSNPGHPKLGATESLLRHFLDVITVEDILANLEELSERDIRRGHAFARRRMWMALASIVLQSGWASVINFALRRRT